MFVSMLLLYILPLNTTKPMADCSPAVTTNNLANGQGIKHCYSAEKMQLQKHWGQRSRVSFWSCNAAVFSDKQKAAGNAIHGKCMFHCIKKNQHNVKHAC